MFSRQKIATVSGLLGTLAVIYIGAAPAYAAEAPRDCKTSARGETTCMRKSEVIRSDENGRYVIKQTQECTSTSMPRLAAPEYGSPKPGSMKVGPVMECSNRAELPKSFKRPHFKF
ncbi:hypothetical protein AB0D14_09605 [Streptomyces sp. NPDC048484]|uniref:hypothetical protein n=1 Tax=Streptomyces sp. NPDC048484 TaxID=3155146 RepID=UPI00344A8CE3